MQLTKNFTLEEMLESSEAREHNIIEQWSPPPEIIDKLRDLCVNLLQPLRDRLGPIFVSSGWRCPRLNTLVGGVSNSWHKLGEAADVEYYGPGGMMDNQAIIDKVKELGLPFDQMIDEAHLKWIHLSYSRTQCRRQMLRMVDGKYEFMA